MAGDLVMACVDLVGRAGATEFEIGWTCPHVPDEGDDHSCPLVTWWASAMWKGTRAIVDEKDSPGEAGLALAVKLLAGARCRCGLDVALDDRTPGCRGQLTGARWEPGCDAGPIRAPGSRGDLPAIHAAANREQRRRQARRRRRP